MESMGDLLDRVREFSSRELTKEEAQKLFGWGVESIAAKSTENDETFVAITFENKIVLYIRYFINLDPTEIDDVCEFTFGLLTDLRSRVKYNIHYSGYIHGQGYIRLRIAEPENVMLKRVLEDFYVPAIRVIYKPIIGRFRGFYSKDYFGIEVGNNRAELYYSPIRFRSEHKSARIWDVVARLHELDSLLKEETIRHELAELDVQLSFLPSVMWSEV